MQEVGDFRYIEWGHWIANYIGIPIVFNQSSGIILSEIFFSILKICVPPPPRRLNPSLIYGFQLFSQGYNMDNDIISWSFHSPVGGKGMGCIIILASWELHFTRENINIWCNILVVIYLLFSRYMLYDPDTGKVLTRTPMSWFKIITFYCIYYTLLAGFWLACLHVFFLTIPEDTPR